MENLTGIELLGIIAVCIGVTLSFAFLVVYLIDLIDAPNFRELRLTKVCEEKYIISYTNMYGKWRNNLFDCTDNIGNIKIYNCAGDVIDKIQVLSCYRDSYDARLTIDRLLNAVRKSKESKRTIIKTFKA
jgi:hypothetical protein